VKDLLYVVHTGNTGDMSLMNSQPSVDIEYNGDDFSALEVKPEYHTGRSTYACRHCSRRFVSSSHLQRHVCSHLERRPYRCPVCSKTFTRSGHLAEHCRIHSDERPFACKLCDRSFRQNSNLNYHVRTVHKRSAKRRSETIIISLIF